MCLLSPCFLLGHSRLAKPATTRRSQVAGRRSQVAGRRSLVAGRRSQVVATMRCGVTLADGGLAGWRPWRSWWMAYSRNGSVDGGDCWLWREMAIDWRQMCTVRAHKQPVPSGPVLLLAGRSSRPTVLRLDEAISASLCPSVSFLFLFVAV